MLLAFASVTALTLLAGLLNGLADRVLFREGYFSPGTDHWKRKYKRASGGQLVPAPNTWYYRFFNLKYKERFPLSATLLVFIVDKWHALKAAHYAVIRLIVITVMAAEFFIAEGHLFSSFWPHAIGIYFLLWGAQAAGFHIGFSRNT